MLKFNNTHIITGQIKQLLADFNLPRYRVYTSAMAEYAKNNNGKESPEVLFTIKKNTADESTIWTTSYYVNYIKDNTLQKCEVSYTNGQTVYEWKTSNNFHYHYNKKELNQTKNLKITNNYYDSYTHEYLGEFLRFQRDYNNIDLMPLYNCFSDRECPNINLEFNKQYKESAEKVSFITANKEYKIYMLPIKLFKSYTIAIDCNDVEIVCGYYDKYLATDLPVSNYIIDKTYAKYHGLRFSAPILYTNLLADKLLAADNNVTVDISEKSVLLKTNLAKYESTLKMFIKIPLNNNSSITILEGDYTTYNDSQLKLDSHSHMQKINNHYVTNYEMVVHGEKERLLDDPATVDADGKSNDPTESYVLYYNPDISERPFKPITNLQLLSLNTGGSHPFADRLIEYIFGNAVTDTDTINDNIKRAQKVMQNSGHTFKYYGLWDDKMRHILYDYMNSTDTKVAHMVGTSNHDILGYVDKDVEKYYASWTNVIVTDRYGKPIQETDDSGNPLYRRTPYAITAKEADNKHYLTQELNKKYLLSAEAATDTPVYKTKDIPVMTISNVDIYDGLYDLEDK